MVNNDKNNDNKQIFKFGLVIIIIRFWKFGLMIVVIIINRFWKMWINGNDNNEVLKV